MSSTRTPSAAEQLDFLGKLQRILNEGQFVASYKYALMMSLAELCVEKTEKEDGTLHLSLQEIAERLIALYWRQAAPFAGGQLLRHSSGREASAVSRIRAFQERVPTLSVARRDRRWPALVQSICRLLVEMPLWRLQLVGADRMEFLYKEELVDGGILLRPDVARCFREQFPVVQALVQMAWLTFVQRLPANQALLGSTGDLVDFLFGSQRSALKALVSGLRDIQHGDCFYCRTRMHDKVAVDHFIPWSRYPRDLEHNFVLAHDSCNLDKRDMLAAPRHLERWVDRNTRDDIAVRQILNEARFMHDLDASYTVAEWQYEMTQRVGGLVWVAKKGVTERLDAAWRDIVPA